MIQPIVEGHGEVEAVPVLVRKLAELMRLAHVEVGRPMRVASDLLRRREGLQRAVQRARFLPGCRAALVLFDADDDCPKTLAPSLRRWVTEAAGEFPSAVVLAHREYEAWFLASLESLRGQRGIGPQAVWDRDPESVRGAKEALSREMSGSRAYSELLDQPALTAMADWKLVHQRCRSFRKMSKETRRLFIACGLDPAPWPAAG